MPTTTDVQAWIGQQLVGPDHDKIGKIDQIYVDRRSGEPTFVAVKTGFFGSNISLVPIADAQARRRRRPGSVQQGSDQGRAEHRRRRRALDTEEQQLYQHYGLSYAATKDPITRACGGVSVARSASSARAPAMTPRARRPTTR